MARRMTATGRRWYCPNGTDSTANKRARMASKKGTVSIALYRTDALPWLSQPFRNASVASTAIRSPRCSSKASRRRERSVMSESYGMAKNRRVPYQGGATRAISGDGFHQKSRPELLAHRAFAPLPISHVFSAGVVVAPTPQVGALYVRVILQVSEPVERFEAV